MPNHHQKDLTLPSRWSGNRPETAPVGHSSRGVPSCQADRSFPRFATVEFHVYSITAPPA
jgi:hypothetical protein